MQQRDSKLPRTPEAPQKSKRRPASPNNSLQNIGTPKKPKVIFSPSTPRVRTPDSLSRPTHQESLQHSLAVSKQLGSTIVVFEVEEENYDYDKKEQCKKPVPAEKRVNTYRGLTHHLLALLRHTRKNSPLKLAQLKGLAQTLTDFLYLLSSEKIKPQKVSKVKKITLLLHNFIKLNLSPRISDNEFKKNSEAFYLTLRFNENQLFFLTQLITYINTSHINDKDDSLQSLINKTTHEIEQITRLIQLVEKNSEDFQRIFSTLLRQRFSYFDTRLQILNKLSSSLQKVAEHNSVNYAGLEYELSQEKLALRELTEQSLKVEKELATITKTLQQKPSMTLTHKSERLVLKLLDLHKNAIPTKENEINAIQNDLVTLEQKIDNVIAFQNSLELCKTLSSKNHEAYKNFQPALEENTRQLNIALNTLLENGDDILTLSEMQPSPHTPKYVSPVAVAAQALTPNTETKAFIQTFQEFTSNILEALRDEKKIRDEEIARLQMNPPVHAPEIPSFDDAFPELQQQKTELENYARELVEDTAEYVAAQHHIKLIEEHIASGVALLQDNHRLITTLAQQKKKAEKSPREKSPFKIYTSLKRPSQTPPSEKKSRPKTTPLRSKAPADMEFVECFSPPQLSPQTKLSFDESSPFTVQPIILDENIFTSAQEKSENSAPHSPVSPRTQIVLSEEAESPAPPPSNAARKLANIILRMMNKPLPQPSPQKNYRVHEVLGDGECGLTAFGITRAHAYTLLCDNMHRVKHLLFTAIKEALLLEDFQNYLADNEVDFHNEDQIVRAYINFDVRDRQIDNGWSHPAVLQALAEIQGIRLRMWRQDGSHNLIPHRTNHYDYAEHIPEGAIQTTDLLFVNGNHFNLLELEENAPQPNFSPLRFFGASEPPQKRTRVFYLSADEAINQFTGISTRLKDGVRELYRMFTTEQRLELENIQTLFNDATASLEKLIEQVNDEEVIKVFQQYAGKIESLNKEAKSLSPKEYLEKAYTRFVEPLQNKQDHQKVASPPRL